MSDPAVLRIIHFDEARRRGGEHLIIGYGLAVLTIAGAVVLLAPGDPEWSGFALTIVVAAAVLVLPTLIVLRRWRRAPIYVVVDEDGMVWGADRSRDLSLPWSAIAKIRAVADPYREGLMYSFAFQAVPGYVSPGQRRDLRRPGVGDYRYTVNTLLSDCPADEFRDLVASRRPDLPILFGSFSDPA